MSYENKRDRKRSISPPPFSSREPRKHGDSIVPGKKENPNYEPSGILQQDLKQKRNGIELKYHPPREARLPSDKWRIFAFNGDQEVGNYELSKNTSFLIGREAKVVDIPVDHPSVSKQHAAIQFRLIQSEQKGSKHRDDLVGEQDSKGPASVVKPYLIDLGSTNSTYINRHKVSMERYYELLNNDLLHFGNSEIDYVLIKEDIDDQIYNKV
jgi:smad nuclear-interacting protein 1